METCGRRSLLTIIFFLAVLQYPVIGRICYHCDSRNGNCPEDSVNGTKKTTCADGNNFCQVVKDGRHAEPRFTRDCVNECDDDYIDWKKDGEEYCRTCCDEDACNVGRCTATAYTLSWLLSILSVIGTFGIILFF